MKILWMSDSPTSPSGFGNVTRFVCAGLADRGHQVSILGWQARGEPKAWRNCTLYPVRLNSFGADVLLNYLRRIQPDVLVTLADVWWLTFIAHPVIANFMRTACIPWALYYPIDGDMGDRRLPPSWVRVLQTVDLPIAMSQYGRDVSQANGVAPAYIPHGVETMVFQPPADKQAAKRALGYDRHFVILSDARNQPRKLLPRTLEIFRQFAASKNDVLLHLHCDPNDPAAQSSEYFYDLRADIEALGLTGRVRTTAGMAIDVGLPLDELAALYQAADVHLLSSSGEGFGLPTLQAAAAGVVPLASDYTASRELVQGHGEPIAVRHWLLDQFGLRRALIDIDDAVARLERLYHDRALLAEKALLARQFAEPYAWEHVVPQWHALLQSRIPRLREQMRFPTPTSQVRLRAQAAPNASELRSTLSRALPGLPDNVQITVNVVESKVGTLMAEIVRDASAFERTLTLPVTLPPVDLALAKKRVPGCVFAASAADVPLLRALGRIFPGLNVWSCVPFELGPGLVTGANVQSLVIPADSPTYRQQLAVTTLALDLDGACPDLPLHAAELGVPCIGLRQHSGNLWPDLSLDRPDIDAALRLGRWMLTDQGAAADICALARRQLTMADLARSD